MTTVSESSTSPEHNTQDTPSAANGSSISAATPHSGRIGFVLKGYPRISETFISNEIRLLEEQGFDIHIFSMRQPRENFTHESVKAIRAGVTYLPESMVFGLPALLWNTLSYAVRKPKTFAKGVRLMLSRYNRAPKKHTWLKHFMQGCYLANKARNLNIVHTHCHFAHTPTSVGMYAALLMEQEFSFSAHAKDIYTEDPVRTAEKLDRAKFAVTCTRYNTEFLRNLAQNNGNGNGTGHHAAPEKVDCVYHGIDLSLFDGNGRPAQASAPYHIMTVARFVEKKGLPFILHALRHLRDEGLEFRYSLIGDGKHRAKTEALVNELGLNDVVDFIGTIPHEKVLDYYRKADLFVLGCIEAEDGDRDGIPNVIAESMAMGVPVVATDVSGIPELIESTVTGISVPQRNADALADGIRTMLTDNALREQVVPAARAKVEAVFNNRELIKVLSSIFVANGLPKGEARR